MSIDKVELYINGNLIEYVRSYSILSDLYSVVNSFTADIFFRTNVGDSEKDRVQIDDILSSGDRTYEWYINGVPVQTGFLDKVDEQYSKGVHTMTISGRDRSQVLVDNYLLSPKTYTNRTIKYIIDDVWNTSKSISSITTVDPNDVNKKKTKALANPIYLPELNFKYSAIADEALRASSKIASYKVDYGQTLHGCFSDLLNQAGLYMYNEPGTSNIIIHKIFNTRSSLVSWNADGSVCKDEDYEINNALDIRPLFTGSRLGYGVGKPGNNVISCNRTRDTTGSYRFFRIVGQTESELQVFGSFDKEKVKNPLVLEYLGSDSAELPLGRPILSGGINKFKVVDVNSIDLSTWKTGQADLLNNELLQQLRERETFKYTLAGHSPKGDAPYRTNRTAVVNDATYDLNSTGLKLVIACTFAGSKDAGTTTELELCNRSPDDGWVGKK